ncbi:YcaO-like family protein [Actinokineospora sp.]|uniref:YcaO-like family protein n=1 Tax=Actinokineospora sp. TaxID=1872133 RepID=UPI0040383BAD
MTRQLDTPSTVDSQLTASLRIRSPERTWALVEPRLRRYGITRVADLTGLDVIGLPVFMAVRPLATTVGVSQGKGVTPLLARLSAVMESIEVCIAERFAPAEVLRACAAELDLPYAVEETTSTERSVVSDRFPLSWVPATSLADGRETYVPLRAVAMDGTADTRWRPRTLVGSSNGLASGNSLAEATVHALLEVIERHSITSLATTPIERRKVLDLATLPTGWCRDLIGRLREDGFWVEAVDCSIVPGTTTFAVYLWRSDMPSVYAGSGSHIAAEIALFRALTEAVQSRMSVISGLREDLGPVSYRGVRSVAPPPAVEPNHDWSAVPTADPRSCAPGDELIARLTGQVTAASGRPVLRVDLTPPGEPFAVCKVVTPGLVHDEYLELPRTTGSEEAPR